MTHFDWKSLRPHVPLDPGDATYVARAGSASDEVARWLRAERSPLLVVGPAGVGKSTELARAAELLESDRVACLVQLDRLENMRRLTPERLLLRVAQQVGHFAEHVHQLPFSRDLRNALGRVNMLLEDKSARHEASSFKLLDAVLTGVRSLSEQRALTLLVDGLQKVPQGTESLDLFEALASIPDEVELVVVVPWHAAFGPQAEAEAVIRPGERLVVARALDVTGGAGEPGRELLRKILLRRLHCPEDELTPSAVVDPAGPDLDAARAQARAKCALVNDAIHWSGGLPRVFLQLLAGAGTYARLRRASPWPVIEDLNDACADQVDSFRRLLLPGDVGAIRAAAGTSGSELEPGRKVRLMAHGVLLERLRDRARVLEVHPLVRAAIDDEGLSGRWGLSDTAT